MSCTKIRIYIHAVWQTKGGQPMLETPVIRRRVWNHISTNAREKGLDVMKVSGYDNHCHCLIQLKAGDRIQEVIRLIKGESSFWINKTGLLREKFEWQRGYYSASIGKKDLERVKCYIDRQEQKHRRKRELDLPESF